MRELRHSGRPESAAPIDRESELAVDELFISVTDRKGIIRLGNDVFVRVSKFAREELVGQPHNVIRHPDMPRCVFQALWDFLAAGKSVAAYVKNKAKDGSYYWVMAVVVPARDGYASVRLKPTTPLLAKVEAIYAELLEVERSVEGADPRQRKPAIAASMARLGEILAAEGFDGYEAFMQAALVAELESREAALAAGAAAPPPAVGRDLRELVAACRDARTFLDDLERDLGDYAALGDTLAAKSGFVLGLADSMRMFSLNAMLAAARLSDSAALGAVAQILRTQSDAVARPVIALSEAAGALSLLGDMGFRIAASKLQTEMMTAFVSERADGDAVDAAAAEQLGLLAHVVEEAVDELLGSLRDLDARLLALSGHAAALVSTLNRIRAIEVNGRVEAAHADSEAVRTLFESIAEQVAEAQGEMGAFDAVRRIVGQQDRATEARARAQIARLSAAAAALDRSASRELVAA